MIHNSARTRYPIAAQILDELLEQADILRKERQEARLLGLPIPSLDPRHDVSYQRDQRADRDTADDLLRLDDLNNAPND